MASNFLHYELRKKIGEGGMGVIYLAQDTRLNRKVALKFLPKHISKDQSKHERFRIEAQAAAGLNHRNIAQVFAIEEANGELCIVLEYVEGQELKDIIDGDELTAEEKVQISADIAEGIKAAHQKGITHRDIKSRNIMVDSSNEVKIMDFGLAKLEGSDHPRSSDKTACTTAYMSPEQLRSEEADARSDIWSYGVVLYELFTGKLPFQGMHEAAIMYSITEEDPLPIESESSEIPEFIRQIINRCLEKNPEERYQDISGVLDDIKEGQKAAERSTKEVEMDSSKRNIYLVIGASVFTVLLTLFMFWWENDFVLMGNIPAKKHMAVLPIENIAEDPELVSISAGLTEMLSFRLSDLEQYENEFWITPASEIRSRNITSASEAYEQFGVNLVISSTIQTFGDSTRLILDLIDTDNIVSIETAQVNVHSNNLVQLEKKAVQAMLNMLRIEVEPVMMETISRGDPNIPEAYEHYLKGRANLSEQANLEMIEDAIQHFEEALDADSEYALAHAGLGEAYWRKYVITRNVELVNQAKAALDKAQSIDDSLSHVQFSTGLIEFGQGNNEAAIEHYEKALELKPEYTEAYRMMATAYIESGEPDKGVEMYKEIIEKKPESIIGYNALGIYHLNNDNLDLAIENLEQVTNLTPRNSAAYSNLGIAFYRKGDLEKTRQMFERSLAIDGNPVTAYNLATLYYGEEMYSEAADMYEFVLENEEFKTGFEYWAGYAAAVEMSEGIGEAKELYERAIEEAEAQLEVNPMDTDVLSKLAIYHSELMNREEAIDYAEKVLSIDSERPGVLLNIVTTFENLGLRENALEWVREEHIAEIDSLPEFESLSEDSEYLDLKEKLLKK